MNNKLLVLIVLPSLALGCAAMEPLEVREKIYGKGVPVIRQSFASKKIRPGDTWKAYLIASHPEGGMKNVVCTVEQPGVGPYPVSFIKIKEEDQKELSGYIYFNTWSPDDLNFVNLTLTVQIQDKAGHYSQPAVFPLSLNSTYQQEPPPERVFQEKDLGPIMITLRNIRDESERWPFHRKRF